MHIEEQFVDWLKAAYFMEVDYAKALEEHLGPAKDYPRLHRLIEEHLWATTSHAYEVSLCLERLNWNVKDLSCDRSSLHAPFEQAPSTDQEAVVNNIIVELTTEHYEIARYIKLITAATNLGDSLTVRVCEAILEDEEAMAGEADRRASGDHFNVPGASLLERTPKARRVESTELGPDPRSDPFRPYSGITILEEGTFPLEAILSGCCRWPSNLFDASGIQPGDAVRCLLKRLAYARGRTYQRNSISAQGCEGNHQVFCGGRRFAGLSGNLRCGQIGCRAQGRSLEFQGALAKAS